MRPRRAAGGLPRRQPGGRRAAGDDRDGPEEQADEGPSRAGGGQEEFAEALGDHAACPFDARLEPEALTAEANSPHATCRAPIGADAAARTWRRLKVILGRMALTPGGTWSG